MDFLDDPKSDMLIRCAIMKTDQKGELYKVANATGIAGGCDELRRIALSKGELPIIDRGMLGMHFGLITDKEPK